ncbi:MAG: PHP domain-containing protein [Eubacteriales bacterium]|nr:PHP domain-containing protein [Eubacteriales bacterium]
MPYRYETHLHTCEASACGVAHGNDYIPFYQDRGYHGLFVTDHFFGGNTAVNRALPWRDQVDEFCEGYEKAKLEGDRRGFQVLFGWEQAYRGDEYLVYGLSREWLYGHPEVKEWTRAEQFEQVTKYGGCVVQAHPFRKRYYIGRIYLNTACVHGVEVYNAANALEENAQAYRYADMLGLTMLAGSDIHDLEWPELSGIALPEPLADERDFATRVRNHAPIEMIAPMDRLLSEPVRPVRLPVTVLGKDAEPVDKPVAALLGL